MKLDKDKRYYILLIGAIGSGKSTFANKFLKIYPQTYFINKDSIFENNKELTKKELFALAFKETERIKPNLFRSKDIILEEMTGKDYYSAKWALMQAESKGFTTILLLKNIPLKECTEQAKNRKIRPIRDKKLISDTWFKAEETFEKLKSIVKYTEIIKEEEDENKVIY